MAGMRSCGRSAPIEFPEPEREDRDSGQPDLDGRGDQSVPAHAAADDEKVHEQPK